MVANSGLFLCAFSFVTEVNVFILLSAVFFYSLAVSVILLLLMLFKPLSEKNFVDHMYIFMGIGRNKLSLAVILMIALFSLGGLPPFIGFLGKSTVLLLILEKRFLFLSFLIILLTIVSFVFYLRLVRKVFFDQHTGTMSVFPTMLFSRTVS